MTAPARQSSTVLEGTVERILYANEENHYTVATLLPEGRGRTEPVTIVGNLASLQVGEAVRAHGEWRTHPKFGSQFVVGRYESVLPRTVIGIKKYLGSGLVPGIGGKFAERIVDHFGERTFEVIDQFSAKLREVEGIGPERARRIKEAWVQQKSVREIMIFLQGHGVGTAHAARIYQRFGDNAIAVVRENPFRLARDIRGIGFRTADGIAAKLGIAADSIHRLKAGVVHVLEEATGDGHLCLPAERLTETAVELLGVDREPVTRAIELLAVAGDIVIDRERVYLAGLLRAERGLATRLRDLAGLSVGLPPIQLDRALQWVQDRTGIDLAPAQQDAVCTALTAKLCVITGGPGVGKTTVINSIVKILRAKQARVLLAAPTGRAAKRMHEATDTAARTIHRLLNYDPRERGFTHNERRPLKGDLLIIDEASMLDVPLAYHLMKAVPGEMSLVLVGDVDQLPSVGPGRFLRDLIDSGRVPVVYLTEIYRQARESLIIRNAHRVNEGKLPEIGPPQPADGQADRGDRPADRAAAPDFFFIEESEPENVVAIIQKLCAERVPQRFGFDPMQEVQVLTPMHRGICGAENLNRTLREALNPTGPHVERYGRTYRVRDRVMQLRNNYDKDVFNGDLGRITRIDLVDQQVLVDVDGRTVSYGFAELDELVAAYAISIHKSQGNEYPVVIVPILTQHYLLLQRNLLYTAITRGKQLVILVGTRKALALAVNNNQTRERFSRLRERLGEP